MKVTVIGLGYVGLPLAMALSKKYDVIGFDISKSRISQLCDGHDITNEFNSLELKNCGIFFTNNEDVLNDSNFYIICVPTPVDDSNIPDFEPLISASKIVGRNISEGSVVVYESTVYPGATEEICLPILENYSKLKLNNDFYIGYSPERINPGDRVHTISSIKKVISGSSEVAIKRISELYSSIIPAGIHIAPSIKTAEACKVIENTQRDLNIAFINELTQLFSLMGLDTEEVLKAAETKWNFISFRPGLVGGHCIGVDPYYLTFKAKQLNFNPKIILSGREINDGMEDHVFSRIIDIINSRELQPNNAKVLIMGYTFKENCNDIRNTKVDSLYRKLADAFSEVDVFDPLVDLDDKNSLHHIKFIENISNQKYEVVIISVAHDSFKKLSCSELLSLTTEKGFVFDLKYLHSASDDYFRL